MRGLLIIGFCFVVSLPCLAIEQPRAVIGGQPGPNQPAPEQVGKPLDWQRSLVEGKPREGFFGGVLDFFAAAGNFFLGTLNFYRAFATWLNFAWVLPTSIFCGFCANGLITAWAIKTTFKK